MPVVSVNPEQYERFELKSAPPDGFVMLRPLPYGQKLSRRSKATKMMMRSQPARNRAEALSQEQVFEVASMDEWAMAHDFTYCIGDHNLEINPGVKFDFTSESRSAMSIKRLDPKVGAEIERLIDQLNNDEEEESFEDFLQRLNTPSSEEMTTSSGDGNAQQTVEENV